MIQKTMFPMDQVRIITHMFCFQSATFKNKTAAML